MLILGFGNSDNDVRVELPGQFSESCINARPVDSAVDIDDVFGQQNQIRVPGDIFGSL